MKEQLISYETAVLAKEKCFNEVCKAAYRKEDLNVRIFDGGCTNEILAIFYSLAPTQSLLQKWLREVHEIHIEIMSQGVNDHKSYSCQLCLMCNKMPYPWYYKPNDKYDEGFKTYEEALEIGLKEALKAIEV